MSIVSAFGGLEIAGQEYTFDHLAPFVHSLTGHGKEGADIRVRFSFQSHVFSKRLEQPGQVHDLLDEAGTGRLFCADRYTSSLILPEFCSRMLSDNMLTWESKDKNTVSNMAVIDGKLINGNHQVIFYYLFPSHVPDLDVELVVKSAYRKEVYFEHIKRRSKVAQLVKRCYYRGEKVPK